MAARTDKKTDAKLVEPEKAKADEFGGAFGIPFTIAGLVFATYFLWASARFEGGALSLPSEWSGAGVSDWFQNRILARAVEYCAPTRTAWIIYSVWFWGQVALTVLMPGPRAQGQPLPTSGKRLTYLLNGFRIFVFTLAAAAALHLWTDYKITLLSDHFAPLITVSAVYSFALSAFLYVYGFVVGDTELLTGWRLYDFWMGVSRNPRIGSFDFKFFCEGRPGLILWVLINIATVVKQFELYGAVSNAIVLVSVFQFIYIFDYFFAEEAILTTMDIVHEKFGLMLAFGDLVWVPFTYTLQARYILHQGVRGTEGVSWPLFAGIVLLFVLGYWIFRETNSQKHNFRSKGPKGCKIWGRPPQFVQTQRGTKLLCSGFWGMSRHMNYTGDLLMAWSWSLVCGFDHLLPYFYPVYFTILLIHREHRDGLHCQKKYGADWDRYCEKVPWRMIPFVY